MPMPTSTATATATAMSSADRESTPEGSEPPRVAASGRLALPSLPERVDRPPVPVLAALAPVVGSVAIWAITGSLFALLFAVLGPLIAVGAVVDGARQTRRRRRDAVRRFDADLAELSERLIETQATRRRTLTAAHPPAPALQALVRHDATRWTETRASVIEFRIGRGTIECEPEVAGDVPPASAASGAVRADLHAVLARSRRLERAPVVVRLEPGSALGLVGPPVLVAPVARAVLSRIARAIDPRVWSFEVSGSSESLGRPALDGLPHRVIAVPPGPSASGGPGPGAVAIRGTSSGRDDTDVVLAWGDSVGSLPRGCRQVLIVGDGPDRLVDRHSAQSIVDELVPDVLGEHEAADLAAALREAAGREHGSAVSLPDSVAFAMPRVDQEPSGASGVDAAGPSRGDHTGLSAEIGVVASAAGIEPLVIDLVRDGPHALVGGTTGSGKSELLVSWALALAARHPPHRVSFLFVDFKGGAAFAPVAALPHVVGMVTDLDPAGSMRALSSLRAEVLRRERVLAEVGARSIEAMLPGQTALARLVIMVDEFGALAAEHPELHTLFADIASRGRSLGVHLVLCTQRPGAVVRDAVAANCGLRIALRFTTAADSQALIGVPDAAALARSAPGRALVQIIGEPLRSAQIATTTDAAVAAVQAGSAGSRRPHRPWVEPLPARVPVSDLGEPGVGAISFGLIDDPANQRRRVARWSPGTQGALLAIGRTASGRSTLLATLADGAVAAGWTVTSVPIDAEVAWRAVHSALDSLRRPREREPSLIVVDDLDVLVERFAEEYRIAFLTTLAAIAREGSTAGLALAVTVRRANGALGTLASGFGVTVVLATSDRQEHQLAGASSATFDPRLPPGAAHLLDERLQIAIGDRSAAAVLDALRHDTGAEVLEWRPGSSTLVVSTRPAELAARLGALPDLMITQLDDDGRAAERGPLVVAQGRGGRLHDVVIAHPEVWQRLPAEVSRARRSARLVFDRCSVVDLRMLVGGRALPPPLDPAGPSIWALEPDGLLRARRWAPRHADR